MNEFVDKMYDLGARGYQVKISNSFNQEELYITVYKREQSVQRVVNKADMLDFCNGIETVVKDLDEQFAKSRGGFR